MARSESKVLRGADQSRRRALATAARCWANQARISGSEPQAAALHLARERRAAPTATGRQPAVRVPPCRSVRPGSCRQQPPHRAAARGR